MSHASISSGDYSTLAYTRASLSPSPATASGPPNSSLKPKPKAVNVFTNDGSFLERFQGSKREEEEKRKKEEDILNRKKHFESRFRNRGKRTRPEAEDNDVVNATSPAAGGTSPTSTSSLTNDNGGSIPAKRAKVDG